MAELRDVWTFDDMVTAHEILDAFEDAAARAREVQP